MLCSAPLLDMVRYEQHGLGVSWNDEYGTAADPVELGWLLSYSPYHHVVEGTAYPAVLFTVFDGDSRVDPLHARKLAAALQHATSSDPRERPVLLRREADVGHGARSLTRTVGLATDSLCFLAHHTGLRVARGRRRRTRRRWLAWPAMRSPSLSPALPASSSPEPEPTPSTTGDGRRGAWTTSSPTRTAARRTAPCAACSTA